MAGFFRAKHKQAYVPAIQVLSGSPIVITPGHMPGNIARDRQVLEERQARRWTTKSSQ